ncbi:MAG: tetratricopeptide repeat protein [Leptonema sp. (in: bacteria)]
MKIISIRLYIIIFFSYLVFINRILAAYPPNYEEALGLFKEKKYEESLNKIREVFDNYKNSLEFRLLAASNYLELKNFPNALAHLKYASQDHPNSYEVYILMSEVYNASEQYQNSLQILNMANQIFKEENQKKLIFFQFAKTYYLMANNSQSRKYIENMIARFPSFAPAIYLDGILYLKEKNYELAEFRFKSLLSLKNLDPDLKKRVYNNLGFIYSINLVKLPDASKEYKENFKLAKEYFKMATQIDPNYSIAKQNLEKYNP